MASGKTPKTVLDKIILGIRTLQEHAGTSRQTIVKYLKREFQVESAVAIKAALKKGVTKGLLTQTGQRFLVTGEHYEQPAEECVDIVEVTTGTGEIAANGDEVTMAYVGKLDDGYQFDAANKFPFTLGAGDVIKGWDRGIVGMQKGGKRKLIVPAKLGYGAKGCSPDIPPNATLHFTVTLKTLKKA